MDLDLLAAFSPSSGQGGGPMDWPQFITFAVVFVLIGGWILWNKMKGRG